MKTIHPYLPTPDDYAQKTEAFPFAEKRLLDRWWIRVECYILSDPFAADTIGGMLKLPAALPDKNRQGARGSLADDDSFRSANQHHLLRDGD